VRGFEIETDKAGRTVVRSMSEARDAVHSYGGAMGEATAEVQKHIGWLDRMAERNSKVQSTLKTDSNGFAVDGKGNTIGAGGDLTTLTGITNFLKSAGLDEDKARSIAREFSDSKGDIPYFSNPGQIKYGGQGSTMSQALLKAAERSTFGLGSAGAAGVGRTVNVPTTENGAKDLIETLQAASLAAGR